MLFVAPPLCLSHLGNRLCCKPILAATTFAIYKPRNVLSASSNPAPDVKGGGDLPGGSQM